MVFPSFSHKKNVDFRLGPHGFHKDWRCDHHHALGAAQNLHRRRRFRRLRFAGGWWELGLTMGFEVAWMLECNYHNIL